MSIQHSQNDAAHAATAEDTPATPPAAEKKARTASEIQDWAAVKLSEALGVTPAEVDVHESLDNYGMGSIQAVSFAGDLEEWLGRDLPATLLWDYPTLAALAAHLAEDSRTT